MRIFDGLGKLLIPVLLMAAPLQAKVLHLRAAQLSTGAGNLSQLQVDLDWPDGAERGTLRFRAEQLDLPAIAYQAKKIDWTCPLVRGSELGARPHYCKPNGLDEYDFADQMADVFDGLARCDQASRSHIREHETANPEVEGEQFHHVGVTEQGCCHQCGSSPRVLCVGTDAPGDEPVDFAGRSATNRQLCGVTFA